MQSEGIIKLCPQNLNCVIGSTCLRIGETYFVLDDTTFRIVGKFRSRFTLCAKGRAEILNEEINGKY